MEPTRSENNHKATYLPQNKTSYSYPPDKTVLLVIDPVNDFLSEGGAAWQLTKNTVKMHNVIENLQRVISGAKAKGIPVLFGPMVMSMRGQSAKELCRICADFYEAWAAECRRHQSKQSKECKKRAILFSWQ